MQSLCYTFPFIGSLLFVPISCYYDDFFKLVWLHLQKAKPNFVNYWSILRTAFLQPLPHCLKYLLQKCTILLWKT